MFGQQNELRQYLLWRSRHSCANFAIGHEEAESNGDVVAVVATRKSFSSTVRLHQVQQAVETTLAVYGKAHVILLIFGDTAKVDERLGAVSLGLFVLFSSFSSSRKGNESGDDAICHQLLRRRWVSSATIFAQLRKETRHNAMELLVWGSYALDSRHERTIPVDEMIF